MNQSVKKTTSLTAVFIFFLFIVVYAIFGSKDFLFGVKISDVSINEAPAESNVKITESVAKITGNAENAIKLTLNGREISVDIEGNFNETIALLSGYNTLNIRAEDKFGYVDEKNYKLIH